MSYTDKELYTMMKLGTGFKRHEAKKVCDESPANWYTYLGLMETCIIIYWKS